MAKLGVNIDHVATLRQARRGAEPDLISAAAACERGGADSIVVHLREDRRHIQDKDVKALRKSVRTKLNLEMSLNPSIVSFACQVKPDIATIVPERRQEITTEGGLNVKANQAKLAKVVQQLKRRQVLISLFIDPQAEQVELAKELGVEMIELHTGKYSLAKTLRARNKELTQLRRMTELGNSLGMIVNAGHGLKYHDTQFVARIPGIAELNIGHSIISRSVFVGLEKAVQEMKSLIES